jgi:type IV pilus assembly protein PilY1
MQWCIPSTVLAADTNFDGFINRVYVGDTDGQMWRFGNQNGAEDGNIANWTAGLLFQGFSGTKIYYPPDLVLQSGYVYLYFGTGDRMNPTSTSTTDYFYAVKDKTQTVQTIVAGQDPNFYNLTADVLQQSTTSSALQKQIKAQLANGDGWYIQLQNPGEKVLSSPVVISGDVIFTTFTPNTAICTYGGTARTYAVDYLYAEAVNNTNGSQTPSRSQVTGNGIPTEPVVTIGSDGIARIYVASSGAVVMVNQINGVGGLTITSWEEVF